MKTKTIATLLIVIALALPLVYADAGHPEHAAFEQAEAIINAEIPCDMLTEQQLEYLGDYSMEQMHPGETHEQMDEIMGGEGSESLRQMHIRMGRSFYCGENVMMSPNMMRMMMGGNMMKTSYGGGMNMMYNYGYGMMGSMGIWSLLWVAIAAFIFGIIFWLTYRLVTKK